VILPLFGVVQLFGFTEFTMAAIGGLGEPTVKLADVVQVPFVTVTVCTPKFAFGTLEVVTPVGLQLYEMAPATGPPETVVVTKPLSKPGQVTLEVLPRTVILAAGTTVATADATQFNGVLESVIKTVYTPAAKFVTTDVVAAEGVQENE
jgi:hypothetical protein